jgi:hypothetical protein
MSLAEVTGWPAACSGERYSGLPLRSPKLVASIPGRQAIPKSVITSLSARIMLELLTSR